MRIDSIDAACADLQYCEVGPKVGHGQLLSPRYRQSVRVEPDLNHRSGGWAVIVILNIFAPRPDQLHWPINRLRGNRGLAQIIDPELVPKAAAAERSVDSYLLRSHPEHFCHDFAGLRLHLGPRPDIDIVLSDIHRIGLML